MSIPINLFSLAAFFAFALSSPPSCCGAVVAVYLLVMALVATATAIDLLMLMSASDCERTGSVD